jgi:DNA-binding XRE family transcriptional regulator
MGMKIANASNKSAVPSALEYFGGAKTAYANLAKAIREAREERQMSHAWLAQATGLASKRIRSFEKTKARPKTFKVYQVLGMLTHLDLVLEQVLEYYTTLTKEQREHWIDSMAEANEGFVAAATGSSARVEPAVALELFIRVRALEELFSPPFRD